MQNKVKKWCPIFYSAEARRTRSELIGDSTVTGNHFAIIAPQMRKAVMNIDVIVALLELDTFAEVETLEPPNPRFWRPISVASASPAAAVLSSFQRVNGAQHLSRIGLSLAVL
jgi:hypothetical protein